MKEQYVVDRIENQLKLAKRYHINVHGSGFSQNGTPDIITHDSKGQFVGIEAKAPKRKPFANQWRRGIEILLSGGRFVVALDDFNLEDMDNDLLPKQYLGSVIGESEFEALNLKVDKTTEFYLK